DLARSLATFTWRHDGSVRTPSVSAQGAVDVIGLSYENYLYWAEIPTRNGAPVKMVLATGTETTLLDQHSLESFSRVSRIRGGRFNSTAGSKPVDIVRLTALIFGR